MGMFTSALCAFFCSPIYFYKTERRTAFKFHLVLYIFSVCTFWAFLGVPTYLFCVIHTLYCISYDFRLSLMKKQAELIAEAQHNYKSKERDETSQEVQA